jgi:hypothetical protein
MVPASIYILVVGVHVKVAVFYALVSPTYELPSLVVVNVETRTAG